MTHLPNDSTSGISHNDLILNLVEASYARMRTNGGELAAQDGAVAALQDHIASLHAEIERLKDFTHWPDCLCAECEEGA